MKRSGGGENKQREMWRVAERYIQSGGRRTREGSGHNHIGQFKEDFCVKRKRMRTTTSDKERDRNRDRERGLEERDQHGP